MNERSEKQKMDALMYSRMHNFHLTSMAVMVAFVERVFPFK